MKRYLINRDVDVQCTSKRVFVSKDNACYPNVISLRDLCLPTNDQGNTPHCVGYTVAAYLEVENWKRTGVPVQFNAELIYKYGRQYKPDTISGTKIEYCFSGMETNDVCSGQLNVFSGNCDVVRSYVHRYGCFMSAFSVTDEWFNVSMFNVVKVSKKPKKLGGHCVLCCGYNKTGIYVQNSWGYQDWGNYGFATIPWKLVEEQFCYGVVVDNLQFGKNIEEIKLNGFTSTS